jgi:hypothetical protein
MLTWWGILVCYLVGGVTVVPLMWWAVCTPRRRAGRADEVRLATEELRRRNDRIECDLIAEATRRHEAARRAHPSSQPEDE